MELLTNALEDFKERLKRVPEGEETPKSESWKRYYNGNRETKEVFTRLRLDWELSLAAFEDEPDEETSYGEWYDKNRDKIYDLMVRFMENDLRDLIEHGDVRNGADALLKSMDGSKKLGREPVEIDIASGILQTECKPKKRTAEFTLHILLHVRWSDVPASVS